jgi:hypothetical protein
MRWLWAGAVAVLAANGGLAADPPIATCVTFNAFFKDATVMTGGRLGEDASALAIGKATSLVLSDALNVARLASTEPAPKSGQQAGIVRLSVATAGTYRIAIGGKAWIDLVRDGVALASTAHGHGLGGNCDDVAKWVEFSLAPGNYALRLSEAATPTLSVIVTRESAR